MASMRVHELAKEFDMPMPTSIRFERTCLLKSSSALARSMRRKQSSLPRRRRKKSARRPRKRPTAALLSRRSARFAKPSALAARAVHPRARLAPSSRSIRLRRHP